MENVLHTHDSEITTISLSVRKDALLADLSIIPINEQPRNIERNKKMKERKKKKLEQQLNIHNQPMSWNTADTAHFGGNQKNQLDFTAADGRAESYVTSIPSEDSKAKGVAFQYTRIMEEEDIVALGIAKEKLKKLYTSRPSVDFDYRFIVAPMVNQSDPPFRTLCLKYGATCAYTEMLYSHRVAESNDYLSKRLQAVDHTFFMSNESVREDKNGDNENSNSSIDALKSTECSDEKTENTEKELKDGNAINFSGGSFTTSAYTSRPLVVQICGNNPNTLAKCVLKIMEDHETCPIDAIDFNLGCPQDRAKEGLYGSYLLDKPKWTLVFSCVKAMTDALNSNHETTKNEDESESRREIKSSDENCLEGGASCCNGVTNCKNEITVNENKNKNEKNSSAKTFSNTRSSETADRINQLHSDSISSKSPDVKTPVVNNKKKKIPLFCKIRICEDGGDTFEATKTFCEGLYVSGVSLICIHGRTRGSAKRRRVGKADLSIASRIALLYKDIIPIISNGNIISRSDVQSSYLEAYPANGLMSAEGILADPCIFNNQNQNQCISICPCAPHTQTQQQQQQQQQLESELQLKSELQSHTQSKGGQTETHHSTYCEHTQHMDRAENISITDTSNNDSKNENKASSSNPDRSALFREYCYLSDLFLTAGGWSNLGLRDVTFDSISVPCGVHCADGTDGVGCVSDEGKSQGSSNSSSNSNSDLNSEIVSYIDCADNRINSVKDFSNDGKIDSNIVNDRNGLTKQLDTAKQHLLWMVEKKGHGRTVRFVHLGTFKRHTDLLCAINSATTLQDLVSISNVCLTGVFGSNLYVNDNY